MKKENTLKTTDLGQATALYTAGFEIKEIDKTNPKRSEFVFLNEDGIEKTINDWWNDKLIVKARSYYDNMKMLKNRIYN